MTMTAFALPEHLSGGDVQRHEQRRDAVANIVVRHALDIAQTQGQKGLGAVQGLDLAFFVHAQDQRLVGRIEVEPHDVADLLDKEGVGGELEMLLAMGLKGEGPPDAIDRGFGKASRLGQGAAAPMGAVGRLGLQGLSDRLGDPFIGDRARAARSTIRARLTRP